MSKEQPEALRLADEYADAVATHRLESLYGTSKSYTLEKARERDEAHDALTAELRRLHAENEALRAQIGQGEPDGFALQMEASAIQAQKVLSDWNEWYGLNGGNAPLPPSGIVKAQEMLAEVRSLLASAPQAPQQIGQGVPDGMPTSAEERHLRRLLAARVGMPNTYFDDGEAYGAEHGISIDFMREPVAHIDAKLRALNVARAECAPQQKPLTDEQINQMWSDAHNDTSTGVGNGLKPRFFARP